MLHIEIFYKDIYIMYILIYHLLGLTITHQSVDLLHMHTVTWQQRLKKSLYPVSLQMFTS